MPEDVTAFDRQQEIVFQKAAHCGAERAGVAGLREDRLQNIGKEGLPLTAAKSSTWRAVGSKRAARANTVSRREPGSAAASSPSPTACASSSR